VAHDLFQVGIPLGEKAVRTAAVYGAILLLLRFGGKRSIASLNTFDFVLLLLLSNVVQNAIIGSDDSLAGGLLGAAVLVALNFGIVRLTYLVPLFGRILQGSPKTLYEHGRLDVRNLRREAITEKELRAVVRRQGLELDDVKKVSLEPEGAIDADPKPKPDLVDVMRKLEEIERRLGPAQAPT
jgi:uncharacterized membrane protein YcaP (DUF421 family)